MSHWAVGSLPRIDRRTASVQGRDDSEHYRCGATRVRDKRAVEGFQKAQPISRPRNRPLGDLCPRSCVSGKYPWGGVTQKSFPMASLVPGGWNWAIFPSSTRPPTPREAEDIQRCGQSLPEDPCVQALTSIARCPRAQSALDRQNCAIFWTPLAAFDKVWCGGPRQLLEVGGPVGRESFSEPCAF